MHVEGFFRIDADLEHYLVMTEFSLGYIRDILIATRRQQLIVVPTQTFNSLSFLSAAANLNLSLGIRNHFTQPTRNQRLRCLLVRSAPMAPWLPLFSGFLIQDDVIQIL